MKEDKSISEEGTIAPGILGTVVKIDDQRIKVYLGRVVRGTVEETLRRVGRAMRGAVGGSRFGPIYAPRPVDNKIFIFSACV